eukprot:XP_014784476.1 PREDICTED: general transcription factor II-I repeat domain-containing protein 2A-like [Octopus bimaculoides]
MEAEYGDVIYHNGVRWLILGKMLKQIWELQNEILLFLDMKGLSCDFEMMFAVYMFEKLNVTLQGKGLFVHEMFRHVRSFKTKVGLFARQEGKGKFCHFPLLRQQKVPASVSSKIRDHFLSLEDEVTRRFQNFKKFELNLHLLSYPFAADIDTAPEEVELELIDMQSDHTLKEMFNSVTLIEFCVKKSAGKMFSTFGSTYIWEQSFSCMKINKSRNRSSVTDINLQAVMRISTNNLTLDFKRIVSVTGYICLIKLLVLADV